MHWPQPKIPKIYRHVQENDWTSWQWQLQNTVKTAEDLSELTRRKFPQTKDRIRITPYLFSLINPKDPQDPIGLQHFPQSYENSPENEMGGKFDQIWERENDFLDGKNRFIQQKYPDIVALRIANTCQSFCRFCFEKERTLRHEVPTKVGQKEWDDTLRIIQKQKDVRQVLLTGGDPSILSDTMLQWYLEALSQIPQLKTIRINTRTLLHNPYRITPEFAKMLGEIQRKSWESKISIPGKLQHTQKNPRKPSIIRGKEIKIGLHFNHPNEITAEALTAMRRLQREGIQLYNQTVLLKNINDNKDVLHKLFRMLREEGVELHYLSQAMAVPGTKHFHTRVQDGQKLLQQLRETKEFRDQLPSFEYSHFTGKQIIPSVMNKNFHESIVKKPDKKTRIIRYKSDITGKWIQFEDGP